MSMHWWWWQGHACRTPRQSAVGCIRYQFPSKKLPA
jgi:hypothetical protein